MVCLLKWFVWTRSYFILTFLMWLWSNFVSWFVDEIGSLWQLFSMFSKYFLATFSSLETLFNRFYICFFILVQDLSSSITCSDDLFPRVSMLIRCSLSSLLMRFKNYFYKRFWKVFFLNVLPYFSNVVILFIEISPFFLWRTEKNRFRNGLGIIFCVTFNCDNCMN